MYETINTLTVDCHFVSRKSPISCPSGSPKRRATGSEPKRLSVPDVVAQPQDASSQACGSCKGFETSPRLR